MFSRACQAPVETSRLQKKGVEKIKKKLALLLAVSMVIMVSVPGLCLASRADGETGGETGALAVEKIVAENAGGNGEAPGGPGETAIPVITDMHELWKATGAWEHLPVNRHWGPTRYETAAAVSQAGWEYADTVILARGDNYVDALAAVPLAYQEYAPILLTLPGRLHPAARSEIRRLQPRKAIIIGGQSAISWEVEKEIRDLGIYVERLGGVNRYYTANLIARRAFPRGVRTAVLAYGFNYPDALAAASYAAAGGFPILLTDRNTLPQDTFAALRSLGVSRVIVIGGPAAVSDRVLQDLPDPDPTRLGGADRYATAVEVARYFQGETRHQYMATGLRFPDAITGGVLAARENSGILLVSSRVPGEVIDFLNERNISRVTIFGGEEAVSRGVEERLINARYVPVTGIALEHTTVTLEVGDEFLLVPRVYPGHAVVKQLTWHSSAPDVAAVRDGKVTALREGTAEVTVTSLDGGRTARCRVTVGTDHGF